MAPDFSAAISLGLGRAHLEQHVGLAMASLAVLAIFGARRLVVGVGIEAAAPAPASTTTVEPGARQLLHRLRRRGDARLAACAPW